MVQARRAHRVGERHVVVEHVEDHLRRARDDARAAAAADDEQQLARRGSSTIVGDIALSIRLPGWIAFASPCTRPNMFGLPGCAAKSSISSFRKKPRRRDVHARAVADRSASSSSRRRCRSRRRRSSASSALPSRDRAARASTSASRGSSPIVARSFARVRLVGELRRSARCTNAGSASFSLRSTNARWYAEPSEVRLPRAAERRQRVVSLEDVQRLRDRHAARRRRRHREQRVAAIRRADRRRATRAGSARDPPS